MIHKVQTKSKVKDYQIMILCCLCTLLNYTGLSQEIYKPLKSDYKALENVIVERYYVASTSDVVDTIGGILDKESITYRIYIDLKPGYRLQAVYGSQTHPLEIKTSTHFFNDTINGAKTGDCINSKNINEHNAALDSWLSMGSATLFHRAVLLSEDKDGSILNKKPSLAKKDGLLYGEIFRVLYFGNDLKFFRDSSQAKVFYGTNVAWSNLLGAEGVTAGNKILIAQLTTNGILQFALNIQVGTPTGGSIRFVATKPDQPQKLDNSHPFVECYNKKLTRK